MCERRTRAHLLPLSFPFPSPSPSPCRFPWPWPSAVADMNHHIIYALRPVGGSGWSELSAPAPVLVPGQVVPIPILIPESVSRSVPLPAAAHCPLSTVHHPTVPGPAPSTAHPEGTSTRSSGKQSRASCSFTSFPVPFPFPSYSSATPSFLPCYVRTKVRENERLREEADWVPLFLLLSGFFGASMVLL